MNINWKPEDQWSHFKSEMGGWVVDGEFLIKGQHRYIIGGLYENRGEVVWLANSWSWCGGHDEIHKRWPYGNLNSSWTGFDKPHLAVCHSENEVRAFLNGYDRRPDLRLSQGWL